MAMKDLLVNMTKRFQKYLTPLQKSITNQNTDKKDCIHVYHFANLCTNLFPPPIPTFDKARNK